MKPKNIIKIYLLLLFVGMIIYAQLSNGFYSDDEIGHFITARDSITNLWHIFSYWSRPAVKIFYVIPAQIGIFATQLLTIIVALLTIYFTYRVAEQYNIKQKTSVALFIGLQPLYFQLSFRFYTEIWASLAIILMLYYWNRQRYIVVGFIASYGFAIRQELGFIGLILAAYFMYKREWKAVLALSSMPILLNIIGWLHTGDVLWLLRSYLPLEHNVGNTFKMGFWVYFKNFFGIFGLFIGSLFIIGLKNWKDHLPLSLVLLFMFLLYSAMASPDLGFTRGQGSTRHILVLSPIIALFAGFGFDYLRDKLNPMIAKNLPVIIIPLLALNLVIQEPPIKLSPEGQVVKKVCLAVPKEATVYCNHSLASYYLGRKIKKIREPLGVGYILYDSHYGYRPTWRCTFKPGDIKNTKWIGSIVSSNKRFKMLIGYKNK